MDYELAETIGWVCVGVLLSTLTISATIWSICKLNKENMYWSFCPNLTNPDPTIPENHVEQG
jgi:hypothetical protein